MGALRYFLDTYAMLEIVKGNASYKKYLDEELYTTILNLYEFYYNVLKDHEEKVAMEMFYRFYGFMMGIEDEEIFLASSFKLQQRKQRISYVDALGYVIARNNNMRFLTGDKEFKDMPNVEFVK